MGVETDNEGKEQKSDEVVLRRMTFLDNPSVYTPPLPFPQRFRKTKLDSPLRTMFDHNWRVFHSRGNISFLPDTQHIFALPFY